VSEASKGRRDLRWAARYARSQARFDAQGRLAERAGGWTEHVSDRDGIRFQINVIPPGEPVGKDYWFYIRLALSAFIHGWFPRASNKYWVVQVRPEQKSHAANETEQFTAYPDALAHVRKTRAIIATRGGSPEAPRNPPGA
jgi:hypothetical protein